MADKSNNSLGETILDFGKEHRGKRFYDVPVSYFDWMLGLDNLRPQLREKIVAFLKTQAEYDQQPKDWREGREDYTGED
jgi:hypothetical protein